MLARGSMFWLWLLLLMIVIQSQKCTGMSPSPLSAPNIEDLSNSAMNTMKFVDYESNAIVLIPLVKRNASPQRTYFHLCSFGGLDPPFGGKINTFCKTKEIHKINVFYVLGEFMELAERFYYLMCARQRAWASSSRPAVAGRFWNQIS